MMPGKKTTRRATERDAWRARFLEKVSAVHKRKKEEIVGRILKRADGVKSSMTSRSKKAGVPCDITVEDVRELIFDAYGSPCKYCGRRLDIKNLVVDHIVPVSKGGPSTRDNLQVICKSSNSMKGSLAEDDFLMLLRWLDTVSEELKKDISIRLARGIH